MRVCIQEISLLPQLETEPASPSASAPPAYDEAVGGSEDTGATIQASVTARGINSECVVCMNKTVSSECLSVLHCQISCCLFLFCFNVFCFFCYWICLSWMRCYIEVGCLFRV